MEPGAARGGGGLRVPEGGAPAALLVEQAEAAGVALLPLDGGLAAYASWRAPGKEGPNEDALALLPAGPGSAVLAVADGLGGLPAGEAAAALAVETLARAVEGAAGGGEAALREAILDGIEEANRRILAETPGAATTLAVAEIQGDRLRSYQVGDSLVLVVGQRGRLKHQTVAHSPVGYAVEAGLLSETQALHHAQRNLVSNVVGSPEMSIDMGPVVRLAPRDTVLLASDGLADNLYPEEILARARAGPLETCARRLLDDARARMLQPLAGPEGRPLPSHPDDLSLILFRRQPRAPGP